MAFTEARQSRLRTANGRIADTARKAYDLLGSHSIHPVSGRDRPAGLVTESLGDHSLRFRLFPRHVVETGRWWTSHRSRAASTPTIRPIIKCAYVAPATVAKPIPVKAGAFTFNGTLKAEPTVAIAWTGKWTSATSVTGTVRLKSSSCDSGLIHWKAKPFTG